MFVVVVHHHHLVIVLVGLTVVVARLEIAQLVSEDRPEVVALLVVLLNHDVYLTLLVIPHAP